MLPNEKILSLSFEVAMREVRGGLNLAVPVYAFARSAAQNLGGMERQPPAGPGGVAGAAASAGSWNVPFRWSWGSTTSRRGERTGRDGSRETAAAAPQRAAAGVAAGGGSGDVRRRCRPGPETRAPPRCCAAREGSGNAEPGGKEAEEAMTEADRSPALEPPTPADLCPDWVRQLFPGLGADHGRPSVALRTPAGGDAARAPRLRATNDSVGSRHLFGSVAWRDELRLPARLLLRLAQAFMSEPPNARRAAHGRSPGCCGRTSAAGFRHGCQRGQGALG